MCGPKFVRHLLPIYNHCKIFLLSFRRWSHPLGPSSRVGGSKHVVRSHVTIYSKSLLLRQMASLSIREGKSRKKPPHQPTNTPYKYRPLATKHTQLINASLCTLHIPLFSLSRRRWYRCSLWNNISTIKLNFQIELWFCTFATQTKSSACKCARHTRIPILRNRRLAQEFKWRK